MSSTATPAPDHLPPSLPDSPLPKRTKYTEPEPVGASVACMIPILFYKKALILNSHIERLGANANTAERSTVVSRSRLGCSNRLANSQHYGSSSTTSAGEAAF